MRWTRWIVPFLVLPAAGCSLLYPFDLPDAADGTVEADGGDGEAEAPPVCGDGVVAAPEVCDTALAPEPCTTACGSTGAWSCAADCRTRSCAAPVDESCNGADDDCDGSTDEGYECAAGLPVDCTSPCGVTGTATCTVTCERPPPWECRTGTELCNGCDDNRDGATDEGCACATGWAVEHPLAPGPESLQAISMTDRFGVVVGTFGNILHYDGTSWRRVASPAPHNMKTVFVSSPTFAVAAGFGAALARWDGTSWTTDTEVSSLVSVALYSVFVLARDNIWVSGGSGTMLHWDGAAWSRSDTHTVQHLYEVFAFGPNDIYVGGRSGTILHWDGSDWASIAPGWITDDVDAIWGADPGTVYLAGGNGLIVRYEPGEDRWTDLSVPTGESFTSMDGSSATNIWAAGGFAGGAIAHFDGASWSLDPSWPSIDRRGPMGLSVVGDDVYAVMHDGGILHRDAAGVWQPMAGAATVRLRSIWGASPQDVYASGVATTAGGSSTATAVLRYDGASWSLPHWLPRTDAQGLWVAAPNDVYLAEAGGTIPYWDGVRWTNLTLPVWGVRLAGIWGHDAANIFVVGQQATGDMAPAAFRGPAAPWRALALRPEALGIGLTAAHGVSADDLWVVGEAGTIARRAAGEDYLDQLASGTTETLRGVWAASATEAFAVGDNGTILHWDGTAWTPMTTSADPWYGVRLYAVWGTSAGNVFAVGEGGTALRYDGVAWAPLPVDLLDDLRGVWGSSANNVFFVADDRSGKIVHRCGASW